MGSSRLKENMKKPIKYFATTPPDFSESRGEKSFTTVRIKHEEIDLMISLIHKEIITTKDRNKIDDLRKIFTRLTQKP